MKNLTNFFFCSELLERTQWLEDTARRLADFSENLRDLTHSVQRCEDRLASHDSLGGASRDPKMLERIKVTSVSNSFTSDYYAVRVISFSL